MADPISGVALIIAIISAIGTLLNQLHIRKCKGPSGCDVDCRADKDKTPPNSPDPILKLDLDEVLKKKQSSDV